MGGVAVVDEGGPYPGHLVGGDGGPYPATAEGYPPLQTSGCDGTGERNDKVGVVVIPVQFPGAEIGHFKARVSKVSDHLLLHGEATMVGSESDVHYVSPFPGRNSTSRRRFTRVKPSGSSNA